ncbi:MAG: helix-turn-helix domain-containing protein [Nannocystaceae bacterium]
MADTRQLFGCPVELALEVLGGKWKAVLLARLKEAPMRYGELRRAVPRLSDKMLTARLHELEALGVITREAVDGHERYRLTDRGDSLRPILHALYEWGLRYAAEIDARIAPS